jgi:hypothetical protein
MPTCFEDRLWKDLRTEYFNHVFLFNQLLSPKVYYLSPDGFPVWPKLKKAGWRTRVNVGTWEKKASPQGKV